MAAILFNGAKPFEQIVNIQAKFGENLQVVSEKKTFKDFTTSYIYVAQGQEQIPPPPPPPPSSDGS